MKILIALLMFYAGRPATIMDPITAFLVIAMVIILAIAGFGIIIVLGTLADWMSSPGDGDK